ncbi:hypothetical protein V9K67_23060 [Paraflavisolibacter sp. H34]|uniref:hypothetical protein n=1 Tax=Huijunlia imazamoxiresistens TaxID=3127457 RepID=UPI00301A3A50
MIENNHIITIDEIVARLKENFARRFDDTTDRSGSGPVFDQHFCFPIVNGVPPSDSSIYIKLINLDQAYDIIGRMDLQADYQEIKKKVDKHVEEKKLDTSADLYISMVHV